MRIEPITLEGRAVRLEPLSFEHHDALCQVGLDGDLWRWAPVAVHTQEEMRGYIEAALRSQEEGAALPFAIVDRVSGRVVGSTRYGNIDARNRRLEIGWTWIARSWQRTAINTECKYLLLRYAFETLGCIRVEFKTDALNARSRQALLRIGAKEEGVFRSHMVTSTGRIRDSVYYSIIEAEWPAIKGRLEGMLRR
ncbi:MAG: GNAT family N-acetyltransferase [Armatimonadetes bacterium]|nr:GNAT family N-acetyltransferase [Armatimonadota bacterium]